MKSPLLPIAWLALAGAAILLPFSPAQAQLPGTVDLSFDPGTALLNSLGAFTSVNALAVDPTGKVLVATSPNEDEQGITLLRLNADGTLDSTFNATIGGGNDIQAIGFKSNGHIVIAGQFTTVDTATRNNIAVLNPDGTLDTTFDPGDSTNGSIANIVIQPSGNIVITGYFTICDGVSTTDIARLTPTGAFDSTFQCGAGFGLYNSVNAFAALPNGQLLAGGSFTAYHDANTPVGCVVRLNSDGSLDKTFTAEAEINNIYYLSPQSSGKVVLGGQVPTVGDQVFRLNADGTLDSSFTTVDGLFGQVLVQPNDQILLAGNFFFVDGVARSHIARLNADGTLDKNFDPGPGANGPVEVLALGANNEVFAGGIFNGIANVTRDQLALLYAGNSPGSVQFSASSYNVNEAGGSVQLMVQRTGGNAGAISVTYATADGTALAGTDYTVSSGTLTWADGDLTPKSFTVPILNSLIYGGSKNFSVSLSSPTAGVTLGVAQAQVLILDSDPAPQPGVTLTSPPVDGLSFVTESTVPLTADVSDPGSILSNVQFTVNGAPAGAAITGTGPYVASFTAGAPGNYTVSAGATDTQGRTSTSSHMITVTDTSNPPPTITLLSDVGGRKFGQGATVPISIDATSADGSPLDSVTFYADGVPFATLPGSAASVQPASGPTRKDASVAPASGIFQASYLMPANSTKIINLLAIAVSKLGGSQSTPVSSVQGVSPSVDAAPLVALNNITGSTQVQVGQTLNIPATVTDPDSGSVPSAASKAGRRTKDLTPNSGQIARMEYFINQLKVKDSAQTPFGFSFTPSAAGQYIVDAIATDGSGVSAVSTPVTVTAIAPPAVSLSVLGSGKAVEGGAKGKVLFTRTGGDPTLPLNVTYKVGGTAVNGTDFNMLSGTILIPAGQTSVKLKITAVDDNIPHDPRVIRIKLRPPTDGSYSLGSSANVKLQLIDND